MQAFKFTDEGHDTGSEGEQGQKDEWKQVDTKKEKDLRSSPCKEEEDETTQYCSCCGASRVQPGAVRCEACGIYN